MITGKPQGKSHFWELGVDGNIVLKLLKEIVYDLNWGYLVQDWVQWQAVKIVLNICVP